MSHEARIQPDDGGDDDGRASADPGETRGGHGRDHRETDADEQDAGSEQFESTVTRTEFDSNL